jgi:hypothetical protein
LDTGRERERGGMGRIVDEQMKREIRGKSGKCLILGGRESIILNVAIISDIE